MNTDITEFYAKQRQQGSIDPLFLMEVTADLRSISCLAMIMGHKTEGTKRENWLQMDSEINNVIEYVSKLHRIAQRATEANDVTPCGNLLLLEENKMLKSTVLRLTDQNDKLKQVVERFTEKYGV